MKQLIVAVAVMLAAGLSAGTTVDSSATPATPALRLSNAQPSLDELVEKFRQAVVAKDKQALHSLRVTQDEYLGIILPGSIAPGEPRGPAYKEDAQQYFWGLLNGKSIYSEAGLLSEWGGRSFRITKIQFHKGVERYADYKAYRRLVLTVEDDAGHVDVIRTGSVAEIDGQFKFI